MIDHGDGLLALRVTKPFSTDSGIYTCIIASEYGCCTTSCEINISPAYEIIRESIPTFIKVPVPVVAMHGSIVSFCAIVSPATAKAKWFICGREITEKARGTVVSSYQFFLWPFVAAY